MKSVDIFVRIDCFDDPSLVYFARQRQLDQNAVNVLSPVQRPDQVQQFRRCGVAGKA